MSYVSTVQPAVGVQGLGGPLGVPQVSPEHTWAAHADLTGRNTGGRSAHRTSLQRSSVGGTRSPLLRRSWRSNSSRVCPPASPWSRARGRRRGLQFQEKQRRRQRDIERREEWSQELRLAHLCSSLPAWRRCIPPCTLSVRSPQR